MTSPSPLPHISTSAIIYNHTYIQFLPGQNKTSSHKIYALCSLQTLQNKRVIWTSNYEVLFLGITLDPKPTYSTHIHNISVQVHKPLEIIIALTATGWGKQKETVMATYKAVMRSALESDFSIWLPLSSSTSINKLQFMQH